MQVSKKEQEVEDLQTALRLQANSLGRIQQNAQAQEILITTLQQRLEAQKEERRHAVYSLAVTSSNLQACMASSQKLEQDLQHCHQRQQQPGS